MTAAHGPRLDDLGVEYIFQPRGARRRLSQVRPLDARQRLGIVDREVYLVPRPSRLRHALRVVGQTLGVASLVATGVLCLLMMLAVLWGVTQAFALLIRVLLGLR